MSITCTNHKCSDNLTSYAKFVFPSRATKDSKHIFIHKMIIIKWRILYIYVVVQPSLF